MPSVVISGAGIAGLSAAWWLARAGWHVVMAERAPDLRDGGYMMGLSGPGYEVARRMGLLERLKSASYHIEENVYRDRAGREVLRLRFHDFIKGLEYLALRRTDLVAALRDDLPAGVDLRFGCPIVDVRDGEAAAHVTLADGSTHEADLVIAAEGMRSALRQKLFAPDAEVLKPLGYRFAVYDLPDKLHLGVDFVSYTEPGHIAEYYSLADERVAAIHVWHSRETGLVPAGARWPMLEAVCRDSHGVVRDQMMIARSEGTVPLIDDLALVEMPSWSRGRVLLLGDAAHSLTLISGQGAGMALTSAAILAEELARVPLPLALQAHELRMRPAIDRLQQRSRKIAGMFVPRSPLAFTARNLFMRHVPRKWLGRYFLNAVRSEILATQGISGNT